MTRPTPEYQRMCRARYKRNPKHGEIQAVLNLWSLPTIKAEDSDRTPKGKQKQSHTGTD